MALLRIMDQLRIKVQYCADCFLCPPTVALLLSVTLRADIWLLFNITIRLIAAQLHTSFLYRNHLAVK